MRKAPPVSVRTGGGAIWRGLCIGLPALAAAVFAYWALLHLEWIPAAAAGAALAAAIATAAVAGRRRAATAEVELRWDGRQWTADGQAGPLEVMVDLQTWMLLRLRPASGAAARWIAVDRRDAGASMPLLRALVHARLSGPPDDRPQTGSDTPPDTRPDSPPDFPPDAGPAAPARR
jgi:hypothetical protein